ncbi:glycosyltransferase family 92 protein [Loktanella sp. D2R18]|uniref:glycosyltransferase family 92 protein n=1 Tax=Rhodobacterales TaxID=204455 RepID=UPI000DE92425|nr:MULTISPECIES: glycosyltransferase family 92 protein [Rhodobacterales]MDO6589264.1 glycosyltransferase family 92 protein [Yoonia sp. 1_MG-2023]RBW45313.1 glycosyltransferase family 92 protein [Loktanella sp. D2R18]
MKLSKLWSRETPHTSTMLTGCPTIVSGRNGLAIVAIMKNEARNIVDWIRFHALAGVQDFFLYDDGSTDSTAELARGVPNVNVTLIPWKLTASCLTPKVKFSRQVLAYCHAIENFGGPFRWMGFIDIDEYIVPKADDTIMTVLGGLEQFTNISLPWTMFGPNGHDTPSDLPAPFAFTTRARDRAAPLLNFKCIIDPTDTLEVRVHRFRTHQMGRTSASEAGKVSHYKERNKADFLSDAALQLNHYYTRSHQELQEKLSKGAVSDSPLDRRGRKIMEKLEVIEKTAVEDRCALDFLQRHGVNDGQGLRTHSL